MARVNVAQKALTDPRFTLLGNRLNPINKASSQDVEQAFGLFLAIKVWAYAQERGTDRILGSFIEAIYPGLVDAMLRADLVEVVDIETVRIKGWEENDGGWLERQRLASRAGGIARSAGSKRGPNGTFLPASSSGSPADLDQPQPAVSSAPTPALTPAQKQETTTSSNPASPDLDKPARVRAKKNGHDPELLKYFDIFYEEYPRHEGKQSAFKAFLKLNPDRDTLSRIGDDMMRRLDDGSWAPDDPERYRFIPLPASYLNGRRWEDGDAAS